MRQPVTFLSLVIATLVIALSSCTKSGGYCEYVDYTLVAQVDDQDQILVKLVTESSVHQKIELPVSKFTFKPSKNDYVKISVREHTSGGCSPFDIQQVSKIDSGRAQLSPSDGQLYQAAFALAELKSCMVQSSAKECVSASPESLNLTENHFKLLKTILPRSIKYCSLESIKRVLTQFEQIAPTADIVACVSTEQDIERIVEFELLNVSGNPMNLVQIK